MLAPRNYPWDKPRLLMMPGAQQPYYLLGLMRSYLRAKDSGEYVTDNPKEEDLWINSGIATVVPAQDILDIINQPDLEDLRVKAMREARSQSADIPTVAASAAPSPETKPDENPAHQEDFTALVSAAAKPKPKDDRT
jgi:hypothetical protein